MTRFIHVEFEDGVSPEAYEAFSEAVRNMAEGTMLAHPADCENEIWVSGGGAQADPKPKPPEQPPIGGFCDNCGHFAARHDETGCTWPDKPCPCKAMLWCGHRWPRPWLAAPEGLLPS